MREKRILRVIILRVLFIVRLVPSPNCPLTLVCKFIFGICFWDVVIIFCGAAAADGREKLLKLSLLKCASLAYTKRPNQKIPYHYHLYQLHQLNKLKII